jgi:signal transduction histidine kinase
MNLGMTRTTLTDVPPHVREAIAQAHEEAKLALTELRDVVRGLHPAVLGDLGLDAALSGIAARSAVPVRLLVELPRRPPRAIERVAYFVVSETLTNVARHAHATIVNIIVELENDQLRIIIFDDGRGGADPSRGTGLRGLSQRIRSVDGSMTIDSPPDGPTLITVELPCAS